MREVILMLFVCRGIEGLLATAKSHNPTSLLHTKSEMKSQENRFALIFQRLE